MTTPELPMVHHGGLTPTAKRTLRQWYPCCLLISAFALSLSSIGCGSDRVAAPTISPREAAEQALATYDTNHDGFLDEKELERCPALKSVLEKLDVNGDKRLSAEEIEKRLEYFKEANIGVLTVSCKVLLDEKPLEGATVQFIPESFMGPAVMPASGISTTNGAVPLQIEGQGLPGVHCGFYKVIITKDNGKGQESLPARYNTKTTLGAEVSPDMRESLRFQLTKKD
jgi:hypothetical protein